MSEDGLGVLAITHYSRLLAELRPDHVHILSKGQIVASGGPELADELDSSGYADYVDEESDADAEVKPVPRDLDDLFAI
jgi:Fe-S cluster assembly ATP-binding protein